MWCALLYSWHSCTQMRSCILPTCFSIHLFFMQNFSYLLGFVFLALLYAAKQLICSTSKHAILHSEKSWIRREWCLCLVWSFAILISVCKGLSHISPWKCIFSLNIYCFFFSSVPPAVRIHTHSHHIFCHSVGPVVLSAWDLLQGDREERRRAAVFSVRWSLVNKCK